MIFRHGGTKTWRAHVGQGLVPCQKATHKGLPYALSMILAGLATLFVPGTGNASAATEITVAVAANFQRPMLEIAQAFERRTGNSVRLVSGSTGKLYAQIVQGAPFHMFFAADSTRPALLESQGFAKSGSRFTYALGTLVLWTPRSDLDVHSRGLPALLDTRVKRVAVANPKTAPYGIAAMQAISAAGLRQAVRSRLIFGESVAQTMMFAHSGNADIAILPASSVVGAGGESIVLQAGYEPIIQQAVVLQHAPEAATMLVGFLASQAVYKILRKFGYGVPQ